ncbi:MAG TPA: TIGR01777 family oxidoreductase [Gemmatimonadales bacterium]|nr:TIGR01777 family oxidoreductase [Gemmatimonadales bacterium]
MSTALSVERSTPLSVSSEEAFAWHARPGALERLIPPWLEIEVPRRDPNLVEGSRAELVIHQGPLRVHWTAEHRNVEPGRGFDDIQLRGPFDQWTHRHRFEPAGAGGSILHDHIHCVLPRGAGMLRRRVTRELARLLSYRHAVTAADLAMHAAVKRPPLHVAVTGASGFIASLLIPVLTTGGHRVTRLVRRPPREGQGEIRWDPAGGGLRPEALRGIDAVVHFAGENIARRWTERRKRAILESRQSGTRLLAEAIAQADGGPRTLISASAIGYYGERGEETLTEASSPGTGFLPEVAQAWEAASAPAEASGVRVVRIRIGLPLSPAGGLLRRMLLPFRLGAGGRLGSGKQWMSWIGADDLLGVFYRALTDENVRGVLNATAPEPVRNAVFARELGKALHRPAWLPVPAPALRLLFGQMADEAILASTRVLPEVLTRSGYRFRHPTLGEALRHVLGTTAHR